MEEYILSELNAIIISQKKNEEILQFNLNVIDELHVNENAHTRILLKLLGFKYNNKYPILYDFIAIINKKLKFQKQSEITLGKDIKILEQFSCIDGYIELDSKCGIIIENKIDDAADQESQLDRYINKINNKIDKHSIYVIYLTADGRKKVSDKSFNLERKTLDYFNDEHKGRFIEINYLEDILPFLKSIFDKLIFYKENILKSAIVQYIDYLEGRFGLRENEKDYYKAMNKELKEILKLDGLDEYKAFEIIENVQKKINNCFAKLKADVYPNEHRPSYFLVKIKEDFKKEENIYVCSTSNENFIGLKYTKPIKINNSDICLGVDIEIYHNKNDLNYKFSICPKTEEEDSYDSIEVDISPLKDRFEKIGKKHDMNNSSITIINEKKLDYEELKDELKKIFKVFKEIESPI